VATMLVEIWCAGALVAQVLAMRWRMAGAALSEGSDPLPIGERAG
jgi:hypothetical protein